MRCQMTSQLCSMAGSCRPPGSCLRARRPFQIGLLESDSVFKIGHQDRRQSSLRQEHLHKEHVESPGLS